MRKLKEVLRLRYELGLGQHQIARSCSIAQGTVSEYLRRAREAGATWPLPEGWDDRQLEAAVFAGTPRHVYPTRKPQPDFAQLHEELQRHPHLTLQLAWEEYRQAHPDGYAYSRFCELYQRWREQLDVVLRQEHAAGEKLFVDYAGATIPVHDPQGGPERQAAIFVAVLGASNYTYAEATGSQELEHWIGSHIRAFEFLGGVPKLVIPDNTRTGVNRACRYEPDLNRTYHELAMHYGVGVLPTRPYKPRDKAKVETGVQIVQRWIVAALRHRKFFSLRPSLTKRSASYSISSINGPFASGRVVGPACFRNWTGRRWGLCRRNALSSSTGRRRASTSTITSRSTSTTTASPTC